MHGNVVLFFIFFSPFKIKSTASSCDVKKHFFVEKPTGAVHEENSKVSRGEMLWKKLNYRCSFGFYEAHG